MRYRTKVSVVTGGKEYRPGSVLPEGISAADLDFLKSKGFVTLADISPAADEVELLVDNDEETCWKISFLSCYRVLYETDANRRKIIKVRDMKKPQLGYYGQDISVCESEEDNFYKVNLNLSIMEMQIECKDIFVEKISKENLELFWISNKQIGD